MSEAGPNGDHRAVRTETELTIDSGPSERGESPLAVVAGVSPRSWRPPGWVATVFGIVLVFVLWVVAASALGIRKGIPQPWSVVRQFFDESLREPALPLGRREDLGHLRMPF